MVSLWLDWYELPASKKKKNTRAGGVGVLNCLHLINWQQKKKKKEISFSSDLAWIKSAC